MSSGGLFKGFRRLFDFGGADSRDLHEGSIFFHLGPTFCHLARRSGTWQRASDSSSKKPEVAYLSTAVPDVSDKG